MDPILSISRRTRRTPFTRRVSVAGVKGYTVYNRMLLPTIFEDIVSDYHHLKQHVQVWDVAVQRQIEIRGRDAAKLVQYLTPRDLSKMADDQCYYIPVVDNNGGMLNDPVAVRHSANRFWISIADSDLMLWIKGLALGQGLSVDIFEADVAPLAVQGPQADLLMSRLFGEDIKSLKFFRHREIEFNGRKHLVARSGFSVQGGFEIYVDGWDQGEPLWDALFEAGQDLNVRAGCPNLIERIEGGLLSYGNDMTIENTPFEAGLGRFCKGAERVDCIGRDALRHDLEYGPKQQIRGIRIPGPTIPPCRYGWPVMREDEEVGHITSAAFSPDFGSNIAIGMIAKSHWEAGTEVMVQTPAGLRAGQVCHLPFK